jgi:hypothetical protein
MATQPNTTRRRSASAGAGASKRAHQKPLCHALRVSSTVVPLHSSSASTQPHACPHTPSSQLPRRLRAQGLPLAVVSKDWHQARLRSVGPLHWPSTLALSETLRVRLCSPPRLPLSLRGRRVYCVACVWANAAHTVWLPITSSHIQQAPPATTAQARTAETKHCLHSPDRMP